MLFSLSFASLIAAGSAMTMHNGHRHHHHQQKRGNAVSVTPHDQFSSSVGVLGCKINTNRVAYWPSFPDCNDICVKVEANGRYVHLLKIDQSGSAYDISYGAWNYLMTGDFAVDNPTQGGGLAATYEFVDASECQHLIHPHDAESEGDVSQRKLPVAAANGFAWANSCRQSNSWVGNNIQLWNIADPVCTYGYDERCDFPDLSVTNQPTCDHQLGAQPVIGEDVCPVYNIQYGTGKAVSAKTA